MAIFNKVIKKVDYKYEISMEYLADIILSVKEKYFGDKYATVDEILILAKLLKTKLSKCYNFDVEFLHDFRSNAYFYIYNDIITRINVEEKKNIKDDIEDKMIQNIIYDEKYVYCVLMEIMYEKMNWSVDHTCHNCTDLLCVSSMVRDDKNECNKFSYNYKIKINEGLREDEIEFITDIQKARVRKLGVDNDWILKYLAN